MTCKISINRDQIVQFCQRWQITELSLFGSVLREDFRSDSDIDMLVTFAPDAPWSAWDLVDIQGDLATILGRDVDLVERAAIETSENWIRRRHILGHTEPLYVAG